MKLTTLASFGLAMMVASSAQATDLMIKAGTVLDVTTGDLLNNKTLLIEDGRIQSIIDTDNATLPAADQVLDLSDYTLLPGLMDMHVHLTSDANKHGYKRLADSLPRKALTGAMNARTTLQAGFTSVRNVGAPGYSDVALRDAIRDGEISGPRIFAAGIPLGVTGGHCDNNLLPYSYKDKSPAVADGPWAAREKVRMNIKYGADVIKICATGGVLSKGTKVGAQQYSLEEMKAIADEAKLRGVVTAAHAHGTSGIKDAIRAGIDSIEHASLLDDEAIELALKHGTYFSMDIFTTEYILSAGKEAGILEESLNKERKVGKTQRESFRRAVEAGVKMVFGSDAGVYPHGMNGQQFSRMVKFGMSPLQAIQAATINAATLLNQNQHLGSIDAGKWADIVAVKGNPLEKIQLLESIPVVIKDGHIVKQPAE
ncbi:Enamidase [Saliniradius amylolyticus]|uniref:Enamidase n=1 Tax=Saliniradius amylolyticus TaxID=2183582 RepID=A0A2S2E1T7_9ALTE|nr:amidohydrolase family protein [Saliniradius amylolyticus]AWL11482.1 Enamidase [Saliniradius amylolyticus]